MTTTSTTSTADRSIRERREALGLTRVALAGEAGCSPAHVQNLEQGYQPKTSEVLGRIHDVLAAREAAA